MYEWIYIYEFEGDLAARLSPVKKEKDYIGFWREAGYSFLFFKEDKKELLGGLFPPFRSETVIRHQDWEAGKPLEALHLERITVHPPWKAPLEGGQIRLAIDPGMAFGSGYHASTHGCLVLLEKLFGQFIPRKVLDLGTGTGVLSIAALKMGAGAAFSLDYNNLAVETARKNRALNGVEDRMHLWLGDARDFLHLPADLLIANLHFEVLDQITDREAFFSRPYFLLSGLLGRESHRIREKLETRLTLLHTFQENFWFSFLFGQPSGRLPLGGEGQRGPHG